MVQIPIEFCETLILMIEWHLKTYIPSFDHNVRLNRVLDKLYQRSHSSNTVELNYDETYCVTECLSDVLNNLNEIDLDRNDVWHIYDWLQNERRKTKGK